MLRLLVTFGFLVAASVAAQASEPWYLLHMGDHTCHLASTAGRGFRTPAEARLTLLKLGIIGDIKTLPEGSDEPYFVEIDFQVPLGSTMALNYARGLSACQLAIVAADQQENLAGLK